MTISLAAIEAADRAATEGPWAIWTDLLDDGFVVVGDKESFDEVMRTGSTEECNPTAKVYTNDDAELIALYRNAVPQLAAALRAVLALTDKLDASSSADPFGRLWRDEAAYLFRKAIEDAGVEP